MWCVMLYVIYVILMYLAFDIIALTEVSEKIVAFIVFGGIKRKQLLTSVLSTRKYHSLSMNAKNIIVLILSLTVMLYILV